MSGNKITLDYSRVMKHISREDLDNIAPVVKMVRNTLDSRKGVGNEYLGWLDLPDRMLLSEAETIQRAAMEVIGNSDVFLVVGIGGSYLGARAVLHSLLPAFYNEIALAKRQMPRIYYVGCDISSDFLHYLLEEIQGSRVTINVISKSGTTTEPALAFRILKDKIIQRLGKEEVKRRVVATTDAAKGSLKRLAEREGYRTFAIPDDVGGRFSVLTAVGLFPIAVGGVNIKELLTGARDYAEYIRSNDFQGNAACLYAAIRNILWQKKRTTEIMAGFEPSLHYFGEWWKQLYGESEGKDQKGIYPDYIDLTTDLHSMGQWIQEGPRSIFETFLWVQKPAHETLVPHDAQNLDNLNYLEGKSIHYVNEKAMEGVSSAHQEGDVPSMMIKIPELTPYYVGQLIYFFEYAVAISGYLLGVNPFNQPGVENYKKNMFALLGKPGFEQQQEALKKARLHEALYEA